MGTHHFTLRAHVKFIHVAVFHFIAILAFACPIQWSTARAYLSILFNEHARAVVCAGHDVPVDGSVELGLTILALEFTQQSAPRPAWHNINIRRDQLTREKDMLTWAESRLPSRHTRTLGQCGL